MQLAAWRGFCNLRLRTLGFQTSGNRMEAPAQHSHLTPSWWLGLVVGTLRPSGDLPRFETGGSTNHQFRYTPAPQLTHSFPHSLPIPSLIPDIQPAFSWKEARPPRSRDRKRRLGPADQRNGRGCGCHLLTVPLGWL